MKREIDVANPEDFLAWIKAALAGWIEETGKRDANGVQIDLDKVLKGLAIQAVQTLRLVRAKVDHDHFTERAEQFLSFICEQTGGTVSHVEAGGVTLDVDPEIDRRSTH